MNPTVALPRSTVPAAVDGSVVLRLVPDPSRPLPHLDATIRRPAPFHAAFGAFLDAAGAATPLATVADDAWIAEGFAADRSAYAQICVLLDEFDIRGDVQVGSADFHADPTLDSSSSRLRLDPTGGPAAASRPAGWLRGFSGMMAALSLPMRRVAIDRGGLFGLITALGGSRTGRPGRSVVIGWEPGRGVEVTVGPGARPVALHARDRGDGSRGSVRVVVGHQLAALAGLLPWVESADLFLLGPGLPSFWSVRLGGIRVLLGLAGSTADDRLGSLNLDPLFPPVGPTRSLMNQVVATFAARATQTRDQVVERTRAGHAEVAATLLLLAARGQVLPDPATGLLRSRAALADPAVVAADAEPVEVVAARSILATTSIQVTRDEPHAERPGRRVEGTILDRPVTIDLDAAGWMTRGHCTCSHHPGGGLRRRGPCRHQLALQARATAGDRPEPTDLAAWFAGFAAAPAAD